MKKYAIFGLMALTCFCVKAAELELSGIRYAGYTTNAVPAGFSILAVPFGGFNTNSFATTNLSLEALVSTNGLTINDRLIAFNEATTNYYYYSLTASGWSPLQVNQINSDVTNQIKVIEGPALSDLTKAQGYAFWLQAQNATNVYIQGVVNTNDTEVSIAANGYTLVGNALPTSLDLNSHSFTNANPWFKTYDPLTGLADEIHVVSGTTYVRNVFIAREWRKDSGEYLSAQVPAGAGVWFLRRGSSQTLKLK
jgi:hypothetical protein